MTTQQASSANAAASPLAATQQLYLAITPAQRGLTGEKLRSGQDVTGEVGSITQAFAIAQYYGATRFHTFNVTAMKKEGGADDMRRTGPIMTNHVCNSFTREEMIGHATQESAGLYVRDSYSEYITPYTREFTDSKDIAYNALYRKIEARMLSGRGQTASERFEMDLAESRERDLAILGAAATLLRKYYDADERFILRHVYKKNADRAIYFDMARPETDNLLNEKGEITWPPARRTVRSENAPG